MVYMRKGVDTALLVVVYFTQHAIYHTRCACCGCYLAGIKHIKTEGVVGLISSTIGNGSASLKASFCRRLYRHLALHAKGGHDIGDK